MMTCVYALKATPLGAGPAGGGQAQLDFVLRPR
jgi:hypothetical protein